MPEIDEHDEGMANELDATLGFDAWLSTACGQLVAAREQEIFERVLPDLFGYYALQMGAASLPLLDASRIGNRFVVGWNTLAELLAEANQLPFSDNQFDIVVLPHVLEFHPLPHQVLREVLRVVRPEGHVLLTGFNPYSLFGLRRLVLRDRSGIWSGEFISLSRAKDWLTLLGFDVVDGELACFNAPVSSETALKRLDWVGRMGERWWPFAGGAYFLHAVKRVAGVRLMKPAWAKTPKRAAAVIRPREQSAPAPNVAATARHCGNQQTDIKR